MPKITKPSCRCAFCASDKPFDLPRHLVEQILDDNVVIFAGAGISTENKTNAGHTFYEEISAELNEYNALAFPAMMELYCKKPDGRINLFKKIKNRLDYFKSFDDFYRPMTRFHRAVTPLYMLRNVVTTNWDDFFERECEFDAFVNDSDLPLWDASERRVMKIHGSIRNPGSIVATTADYDNSFQRLNNGPMGARLKIMLTENTFIYTGYSLTDTNYITLLNMFSEMMRPHSRTAYYISPVIDHEKLAQLPVELIPIETDGSFFFEQLRLHIEEDAKIVHDSAFEACDEFLDLAIEAHHKAADKFQSTLSPLLIFTLSYQDGLIHGLKRIKNRRTSGEYHNASHVARLVGGYDRKKKEYLKRHDYWNAYYAVGYGDAVCYLLAESGELRFKPPLYGIYGRTAFYSMSSVLRFPKRHLNRFLLKQAGRIIKECISEDEILIPDHTAYL